MAGSKKIVYSAPDVLIKLNFAPLEQRLTVAQQWLGDRVLEDCKSCMPLLTGSLQQRSVTEDFGKKVVFPGPYANYLYRGKVMVDSVTGKGPRKIPTGPGEYVLRFRKGAKLVPTERPLTFSRPEAVPEWFEHAKKLYLHTWEEGVKKLTGGK